MEPSAYNEYSAVYDYFSNPELFPALKSFIVDMVVPNIHPDACITDIGGGTGLFASILLEHVPGVHLTIVEPSASMLAIAKKRLGARARYCQSTIEEALPQLEQQDAFIFQRSLYAIYQSASHCKKLFYQLNRKLKSRGCIFIADFKDKYNLDEMRKYIELFFSKAERDKQEFSLNWPVLERAMLAFNQGVDDGRYHLLKSVELDDLMRYANCRKLSEFENHQFSYVKESGCFSPYWLHQLAKYLT